MRFEALNTLSTSALNAVRFFQQVVNDAEMQKAHQQTASAFSSPAAVHPNLGGCVDSPEAATVVLMVVGAIGIYYGSTLFLRAARKRGGFPTNA